MILYLIAFSISTIFLLQKRNPSRLVGCFISFLSLTLLVGLRHESVGADTTSYYYKYWQITRNVGSTYIEEKLEPLSRLLFQCVNWCSGGPETVIFVAALITLSFIIYTMYRYSLSPLLSLAVFCSIGQLFSIHNTLRQGLAMAIVFYSVRFIMQRKLPQFIITIIIAMGFHASAMIFFPVYFLSRVRPKQLFFIGGWLVSLVCLIKKNMGILILQKMLFMVPERYFHHFKIIDEGRGKSSLGVKLMFVQCVFLLLIYSYGKIKDERHRMILLFSMVGIIAGNMFYWMGFVGRISTYFQIFTMLSVPIAVTCMFKGYQRMFVAASVYFGCLLIFIRELTRPEFVYRTIFYP